MNPIMTTGRTSRHISAPLGRTQRSFLDSMLRWSAAGIGFAAGAYAVYVGVAWARYGHPARPKREEHDESLNRFMPLYDVVERHHIRVDAPADVTLAVARDMDLFDAAVVRALIKGRELLLGARPDLGPPPGGLLVALQAIGWVVLAETPGQIVVGAVTKPWEANATFRSLSPERFEAFNEPDYVKIIFTLRADATTAESSMFRTETRAVATDAVARAKFRRYWALLSPGILLIRRVMLGPLKAEAERRGRTLSGRSRSDLSPSLQSAHQ